MGARRKYSKRLGHLTHEQFQAALDRFDLGELVDAQPAQEGLFGQNVFLTSTTGKYVLRGCPHYDWQFPKERFFARHLHEQTQAPAPWPYRVEPSDEIFGWSFALMPRLPGRQVNPIAAEFGSGERLELVRALGENLAFMPELTWPCAGEYDLDTDTPQPFGPGFEGWIIARLRGFLEECRCFPDRTTDADAVWVEEISAQYREALRVPFEPAIVHHDYGFSNTVIERRNGGWRVTGVFDLMEAYFGDGEEDLCRTAAWFMNQEGGMPLAQEFVRAYTQGRPPRPGFKERFPIYMLSDRVGIWAYGIKHGWFKNFSSLRAWAENSLCTDLF